MLSVLHVALKQLHALSRALFPSGLQVHNIFDAASSALVAQLQDALSQLKVCHGATCRVRSLNLRTSVGAQVRGRGSEKVAEGWERAREAGQSRAAGVD